MTVGSLTQIAFYTSNSSLEQLESACNYFLLELFITSSPTRLLYHSLNLLLVKDYNEASKDAQDWEERVLAKEGELNKILAYSLADNYFFFSIY